VSSPEQLSRLGTDEREQGSDTCRKGEQIGKGPLCRRLDSSPTAHQGKRDIYVHLASRESSPKGWQLSLEA